MDIADMAPGPWPVLVQKWRAGWKLRRDEIEQAFAEDGDIPEIAKPLIRALIAGGVRLKRGKKSDIPERAWRRLVLDVECLRRDVEHYKRHGECDYLAAHPHLAEYVRDVSGKHGSPLLLALEATAEQYGISYDALEQQRKRLLKTMRNSADKN